MCRPRKVQRSRAYRRLQRLEVTASSVAIYSILGVGIDVRQSEPYQLVTSWPPQPSITDNF